MILARTRAALAAAKERGVTLGNPKLAVARVKAEASQMAAADDFAPRLGPVIRAIQKDDVMTSRWIARKLAERNELA